MIIITGASRGIGKYLFEKFWEGEEIVYGTYHTTQPNTDKIDFLTKVDISNHSDVRNWIDTIKNKMKEVILINCAGINYNSFDRVEIPMLFDASFRTYFFSFLPTKETLSTVN